MMHGIMSGDPADWLAYACRVERSLYERANGYNYEAVKVFMPAGSKQPVIVHYVEHCPPEACKLAGTASAGLGTMAIASAAALKLSASSNAFVISSTNSGMPSVRSMMSCRMFARSGLLPAIRSIIAFTSRRVSRLRVTAVT
jgi:hypothetical protein